MSMTIIFKYNLLKIFVRKYDFGTFKTEIGVAKNSELNPTRGTELLQHFPEPKFGPSRIVALQFIL